MKALFPSLLIFDLANLVWRATSVKVKGTSFTTSKGERSGHVYLTCNSIISAKKKFGGNMIFCNEGMEVERFRLHPDYKKGRATIKDEFDPFPDVMEMLSYMRASLVTPVGAEADDAIATLCRENTTKKITIISSDKDLWTCLHNTKVTIKKNQELIYKAQAQEEFRVEDLRAVPLVKALYGDKSDNIPSVPRLRWDDIKEQMQGCITPDDLYAKLGDVKENTRNKLLEYEKQVRTMFQVTTLKTCKYDKVDYKGDAEKLKSFLERFECKSLLSKIQVLVDPNAP